MKLLLVDDNALFLEGLTTLLRVHGRQVVGVAASGRAAIEAAQNLRPELVLMDIEMPGESGIEATRQIKALLPEIKIIMMTVSQDDQHLFDAIAAGASGYLMKGASQHAFLDAIDGVARGESPLSPGLAGKLMAEFARRDKILEVEQTKVADDRLTVRQKEILARVARGQTYKAAASEMGLAESTIKYHMGEITNLLHLSNRAEAIAHAANLGLIPGCVRR